MTWSVTQAGSNASGTTNLPLFLPAATTAGTLLIVALATASSAGTLSGPSGWLPLVVATSSTGAEAAIFAYPSNPGGLYNGSGNAGTFSNSGAVTMRGVMMEFSSTLGDGMTVLATATASGTTPATSYSATVSPGVSGGLGLMVTGLVFSTAPGTGNSWTPPSGWANFIAIANSVAVPYSGSRLLNVTSGSNVLTSTYTTSTNMTSWEVAAAVLAPLNDSDASNAAAEGVPATIYVDDAVGFP